MKSWQVEAEEHAREESPKEACGLIVDGKYVRCKNTHGKPEQAFRIDPEDWAAAEDKGTIEAVVHSHPNGSANPSEGDKASCESLGIPWYIVSLPDCVWRHYKPTGLPLPLLGRPFIHGVVDCYTLIRDTLYLMYGVQVMDFERWDDWWKDEAGSNLYRDNYEKAGFIDPGRGKDDLHPGDMIVMSMGSSPDRPNHAGIYLGNGRFIHHPVGRNSRRDKFAGYWYDIARDIRRHKDLPDEGDSVIRVPTGKIR